MTTETKREKPKVKKRKPRISIQEIKVKEVMAAKGISSQEMADRIPTNAAHVSRILHGKRPCLSLPLAIRMAQILNTPVEELFIIKRPKGE